MAVRPAFAVEIALLSGEQPSVGVAANHDFASGLYGGVSVASARMRSTRLRAQVVSYAGFARRMDHGYGWDVGVADVRYSGASRYDYQELYAGVNTERLGARVSVAPDYLGAGRRSVYVQVNGSWLLGNNVMRSLTRATCTSTSRARILASAWAQCFSRGQCCWHGRPRSSARCIRRRRSNQGAGWC